MNAEENTQQQNEADTEQAPNGASRGEFLKWGTVALSGLYVGPKITSFAIHSQLGHAGSVPVSPVPTPPVPYYPPTPIYPATGGASELTPAQRRELKSHDRTK